MNVAFPALLLFFIILPGFIFFYAFKRTEKTVLDFSPFAASTIKSIVAAAVLQIFGLGLIAWCTPYTFQVKPLLVLLIGGASVNGILVAEAITNLASNALLIFWYFLGLYLFAGFSGYGLRQFITKWKLDTNEGVIGYWLRFDTPWYYLFNGNRDDTVAGVLIAAIVDLKDGSYLFTGILSRYFLNDSGQLDRLVLVDTQRRSISLDRSAITPGVHSEIAGFEAEKSVPTTTVHSNTADESSENVERFYGIQGDYFVLRYDEIITLNIRYLYEESVDIRQ